MKRATSRARTLLTRSWAWAWVVMCAGCLPHKDADELPVIHDGLSDVVQAWIRAVESADVDAISDLHMPNSRAYPLDEGQTKGMQDITDGYARLFSTYQVRLVVRDAHYLATPQLMTSWGLAEWTLTPRRRAGPPIVVSGRFSDLVALDHGRWRYVVAHVSAAMPLAAMAPAEGRAPDAPEQSSTQGDTSSALMRNTPLR